MTYYDAINWKNSHQDLIGSIDAKGFVVSALMIVPSDPKNRDVFLRDYLFTEKKDSALIPYANGDMQVWSVDLGRLESHGILFYNVLAH